MNNPINLENIYLKNGNDKSAWISFVSDINNEKKNEKNISYLKNKLLQHQQIDLTLDIIDFIIDRGIKSLRDKIFQKDFFDTFIKVAIHDNKDNNIEQKALFLIKKWLKKLIGDNENLNILLDYFKQLKNEEKVFPHSKVVIQTYDQYIQSNVKNFVEKKNLKNNEDDKNPDQQKNKDDKKKKIYIPLKKPFDIKSDNLLPDINFPDDGIYNSIFSNLQTSEIPSYFKTIRSKSIIESTANIQKINQSKNTSNRLSNINEESNENDTNDDKINDVKISQTQKVLNVNDLLKNSNQSQNQNIEPTSTFKNYRNNPSLFQNKWNEKISSLNKWIKEGKSSKNFDNLKQGIFQIIIGLDEIEEIIFNCAKIGDDDGRNKVSYIKSDMEQTCFRYECLIQGKKPEKFWSAFDGNVKKYYFNKENLLEEINNINNININIIEGQEPPKKEKKGNTFGQALKKFGQKIGGKSRSKSKERNPNNDSQEMDDIRPSNYYTNDK